MSRHPDNPLWDDATDSPWPIHSAEKWAEAEANGHITPEHVAARLEIMLRVAFGEPVINGVAYDPDGFERAAVAVGWTIDGWRLKLYSNDHDPPHVHFFLKGDPKRQVRLSLRDGQPLDGETVPPGLRKELRKASEFIVANQGRMTSIWSEREG